MSLPATTSSGDALMLESFDGKQCVFDSARAFAPGNPLRLRVAHGESSLTLEVKSIGSRKRDNGRFEVRARVATMPAEVRESLLAYFARA